MEEGFNKWGNRYYPAKVVSRILEAFGAHGEHLWGGPEPFDYQFAKSDCNIPRYKCLLFTISCVVMKDGSRVVWENGKSLIIKITVYNSDIAVVDRLDVVFE